MEALAPGKVYDAVSAEESATVIVDIRSRAQVKEEGAPDFKGIKGKRYLTLPYTQVWVFNTHAVYRIIYDQLAYASTCACEHLP